MERIDVCGASEETLAAVCREEGIKPFRAEQVFEWVHRHAVSSWEEMRNVGKKDLAILQQRFYLRLPQIKKERISQDGTRKFLFSLADGETIETVLMGHSCQKEGSRDRVTVCLSTQVGCVVGCPFCATGQMGFRRNMTAGEIVGQILALIKRMREDAPTFRVNNLVYMGMGEPFFNEDALYLAIAIFNHPQGQNIGMRRMTLSTSGVVPGIRRLARENQQIGLAVSLHSGRNEVRDRLVPLNKKYPLEELLAACRVYTETTGRRVTFEIALTEESASLEEAQAVGRLLKGFLAHVNLILLNPVPGCSWQRPSAGNLNSYRRYLEQAGIVVTVREEKGTDIEAACGQLRQEGGG